MPLPSESEEYLLKSEERGREQYLNFVKERILNDEVSFHSPIKRNKLLNFQTNTFKQSKAKNKSTEVNRDILSMLLSLSVRKQKVIDFQTALSYPLSQVPLSLCNADGSMRKAVKSKLVQCILSRANDEETLDESPRENSTLVVDYIALIRTMVGISDTFEELAMQVVKSVLVPKGYQRVDFVADTYLLNSIKNAERAKRGMSSKILIASSKSKVPRDFKEFLKSGENKTRMIKIIFDVLKENRATVLNTMRTQKLVTSMEGACMAITLSSIQHFEGLLNNQEEADTKVILHSINAMEENPSTQVIIKSPSGDTDIECCLGTCKALPIQKSGYH